MKNNKVRIVIDAIYLLTMLVCLVFSFFPFEARSLLMCLLFISFIPLIRLVEHLLKLKVGPILLSLTYLLAIGSILGSCYNFYTYIPFLDTVLHGMSGIIFACLGASLAMKLFKEKNTTLGVILFGAFFSLSIAVLWEVFEFTATSLFGFDMMEDSYVYSISSYLLSGSHIETIDIDGITKTVIHYGDGLTYTIDGYLDIGLLDTLEDMIVCLLGTIIFVIITIISNKSNKKINQSLIPQLEE